MIASDDSKGVIEMIGESKGKKITNISGGSKKLFIFEEENCKIKGIQRTRML